MQLTVKPPVMYPKSHLSKRKVYLSIKIIIFLAINVLKFQNSK